MPAAKETVACRTPTPGKTAKRIAKDRFDLLRKTILKVTPKRGDGVDFVKASTPEFRLKKRGDRRVLIARHRVDGTARGCPTASGPLGRACVPLKSGTR